ncbi:MAG: DUF2529 family protein [Bacteroidales bacterium]
MYRLLIFPFVLISFFLQGQINNEPGEVYLSNGSMFTGNVYYYIDQPANVMLTDSNNLSQKFNVANVSKILLENGKKFTTKFYKTQNDSTKLLFQSIIESAKISLYGREEMNALVMYVEKGDKLIRLENNASSVKIADKDKVDVKRYRKNDNQYIGVLSSLMSDRFDLVTNMSKVKLTEKDITEVILNYNKGEVTYYLKSNSKFTGKPNWMLYAQFSNYCSLWGEYVIDPSYGIAAGFQYYFAKNNRNSIKVNIEYQSYKFEEYDDVYFGIGFRYYYDIYKSRPVNIYGMMNLLDIVVYLKSTSTKDNIEDNSFGILPHFSPGLGLDVKLFPKFIVYGEINRLFQFKCLPRNFSFGIKYDIGK